MTTNEQAWCTQYNKMQANKQMDNHMMKICIKIQYKVEKI